MEAEGDPGKSVEQQSQVLPGPGITESRGTKNPRRDQALLRELRKEEKELKDEERELVEEREQMEPTDKPEEHQRSDSSNPDCSSIKQSRNLLDRIERNAQRQLAVTDEIRRLSEQMRAVKARGMPANEGEQKMETAALSEHDDEGDAEIGGGLEWPLPAYGVVAARDHVDHNRNLLFACYRSRSQIFKEEDPFLVLIGPSRAIVCEESIDFEIQLKVRGTTESEDRALITGLCTYNRGDSTVCFTNCFCTAELRLDVLEETVQATVLGVRVKDGSWPSGWGGRVACSVIDGEIDATPGELDLVVSRRRSMPVTYKGYLLLSRNVVFVDVNRRLNFLLEAYSPSGDTIAQKKCVLQTQTLQHKSG